MAQKDMIAAHKLWKAYKVSTPAYREIASKYGLTTADLNARCMAYDREKLS